MDIPVLNIVTLTNVCQLGNITTAIPTRVFRDVATHFVELYSKTSNAKEERLGDGCASNSTKMRNGNNNLNRGSNKSSISNNLRVSSGKIEFLQMTLAECSN